MEIPLGGKMTTPYLTQGNIALSLMMWGVSKLTSNVITQSMYAACDDSGNEYLMIDSIVEYQKSDKALSVASQKVVHRDWSFMRRSTAGWHICVQWRYGLIS